MILFLFFFKSCEFSFPSNFRTFKAIIILSLVRFGDDDDDVKVEKFRLFHIIYALFDGALSSFFSFRIFSFHFSIECFRMSNVFISL